MTAALMYGFTKGSFHAFTSWMASATLGRPNQLALVIEDADENLIRQLIRGLLPDTEFYERIRKRNYVHGVSVFVNTFPRTQRQKFLIKDILNFGNVIFVNPAWYFAEETSIPKISVSISRDLMPEILRDAHLITARLRKSYSLFSYLPVYVSLYLRDKPIDAPTSPNALHADFVEFWRARGIQMQCFTREFIANVDMVCSGLRVDASDVVDPSHMVLRLKPTRGRDLNMIPVMYLLYDNGTLLFQNLVQCAMGRCTRTPIRIIDSTSTTLALIKCFCKRCNIIIYDSQNVSQFYDIVDHAQYHLHVFLDVDVSWEDIMMVKQYSNCIIIRRDDTACNSCAVTARFKSNLDAWNFHEVPDDRQYEAFMEECYGMIVREPLYVYFVRQMIDQGRIAWGVFYDIAVLTGDYEEWCNQHRFPVEEYKMDTLPHNESFCIRQSMFFRCEWTDSNICFRECKKLYGKQM